MRTSSAETMKPASSRTRAFRRRVMALVFSRSAVGWVAVDAGGVKQGECQTRNARQDFLTHRSSSERNSSHTNGLKSFLRRSRCSPALNTLPPTHVAVRHHPQEISSQLAAAAAVVGDDAKRHPERRRQHSMRVVTTGTIGIGKVRK